MAINTPDFSSLNKLFTNNTPEEEGDSYISPNSERPKTLPKNPLEPRTPDDPIELQDTSNPFGKAMNMLPYFRDISRLGKKPKNVEDLASLQLPKPGTEVTENEALLLASLGLLDNSYILPDRIKKEMDAINVMSVMGFGPKSQFSDLYHTPINWLIGGKDADGEEIPGAFDVLEALAEGAVPPALDFLEPYFKGMSKSSNRFETPTVNEDTTRLYKQFVDGEITFKDLINKSQENFRERDTTEQVVLGLLDPSNFATGGVKAVGVTGGSLFTKAGLPLIGGIMKNVGKTKAVPRTLNELYGLDRTLPQAPYKYKNSILRKIEDISHNLKTGNLKPNLPDNFKGKLDSGKELFNAVYDEGIRPIYNDYAAFTSLVRTAQRNWIKDKGFAMPDSMKTNYLVQLFAGSDSAAGHVIDKTHKKALGLVDNVVENIEHVNSYLLLRHMKDVLKMKEGRVFTKTLTPQVRKILVGTEDVPATNPTLNSSETVDEALKMLEEELGAELFGKVKASAKIYTTAIDNQFQKAIDAGIVDPDIASELRLKYPWYNPIRYVDELKMIDDGNVPVFSWKKIDQMRGKLTKISDEAGDTPIDGISGYGSGYAGVKQRVLANLSDEGSELERLSPTEAFEIYMASMEKLIAFNQIKKSLAKIAVWTDGNKVSEVKPNIKPIKVKIDGVDRDIFRPVKNLGHNQVSYLDNGGKQYVLQLDDKFYGLLETLRKGGNKEVYIQLAKYIFKDNLYARILRRGFIQNNPPVLFALTAADAITQMAVRGIPLGLRPLLQEAYLKGFGKVDFAEIKQSERIKQEATIINGMRSAFRGIFKDDPVWNEMMQAGGNPAGWAGKDYQAQFQKTINKQNDNKLRITIDEFQDLFNPKDWIGTMDKIAHASEMGPRMAVYMKSRLDGLDPMMGAIHTRNSAGDFQQGGIATQVLNTAFWYLQPAVQGTLAPIRAIRDNPKLAFKGLATFAQIQTFLYIYNRQFEEYADVPRDEKNGLLVMLPPRIKLDGTKEPRYFSIDTYIPFGIPYTYMLEKFDKKMGETLLKNFPHLQAQGQVGIDPFVDMLGHTFNASNPLGAVMGNITNIGYTAAEDLRGAYSFIPTIGRAWVDLAENRASYTGMPIVPDEYANRPINQQHDATTSEAAKFLGNWFKQSPFKIDYLMNVHGEFGNIFVWTWAQMNKLINGKDPVVEALVADFDSLLEMTPTDQYPVITREFLADIIDPRIRDEVRIAIETGRRSDETTIPVVGTLINKFIKERGGALYNAGLDVAEDVVFGFQRNPEGKLERVEISATQTRLASKQIALIWQNEIMPLQHANDNNLREGTITPAQWENNRQIINTMKSMMSMILDTGLNLPLAAQFLEVENDEGERIPAEFGSVYEWWLDQVNTMSGKIDDRRYQGAALAAAYYSIPRYDLDGKEMTGAMQAGTIDWYRLEQDQERFKKRIGASAELAMDEWLNITRSSEEINYRKDMELISIYYDVIDTNIDLMTKIFPKDKNGKDVRYHYNMRQSYEGKDRFMYNQTYVYQTENGSYEPILNLIDSQVRKDREMIATGQLSPEFIMKYKDVFFNQPGDFVNGQLQISAINRYKKLALDIETARLKWGRVQQPKTIEGIQLFADEIRENPPEFNIIQPK